MDILGNIRSAIGTLGQTVYDAGCCVGRNAGKLFSNYAFGTTNPRKAVAHFCESPYVIETLNECSDTIYDTLAPGPVPKRVLEYFGITKKKVQKQLGDKAKGFIPEAAVTGLIVATNALRKTVDFDIMDADLAKHNISLQEENILLSGISSNETETETPFSIQHIQV